MAKVVFFITLIKFSNDLLVESISPPRLSNTSIILVSISVEDQSKANKFSIALL
jgi:hypothetical protein